MINRELIRRAAKDTLEACPSADPISKMHLKILSKLDEDRSSVDEYRFHYSISLISSRIDKWTSANADKMKKRWSALAKLTLPHENRIVVGDRSASRRWDGTWIVFNDNLENSDFKIEEITRDKNLVRKLLGIPTKPIENSRNFSKISSFRSRP